MNQHTLMVIKLLLEPNFNDHENNILHFTHLEKVIDIIANKTCICFMNNIRYPFLNRKMN